MNGSYYEYFPTVLVFSSLRTAIVFFLSLNIVQLLKKLYTAASSHGKTEKLSLTTFEMALVCERFHTVAWLYIHSLISLLFVIGILVVDPPIPGPVGQCTG